LNSLPDKKYETFVLTLTNGKQSLNYNDVSAALVNYEERRKNKQFFFSSTLAEALVVRGKGSNQKGKGVRGRSKSRPGFRDLKKSQCVLCKELEHWTVDCPRIKDKKESKTEANLAQVISTQASSSQAGGSDSDSSVYSFSITTPTISYSGDSE